MATAVTATVDFSFGDRVQVKNKPLFGRVAFIGSVHFKDGQWIGIVLDEPKGKNNGTVQGQKYFECKDNYGLMAQPHQVS